MVKTFFPFEKFDFELLGNSVDATEVLGRGRGLQSQYQCPPFRGFEKKVRKKMNVSFVYLPVGVYYVSFQNRLFKIKYGFQGSISNVDLHISSTPNLNLLRVLAQDLLIQFPKTFLEFPKTSDPIRSH